MAKSISVPKIRQVRPPALPKTLSVPAVHSVPRPRIYRQPAAKIPPPPPPLKVPQSKAVAAKGEDWSNAVNPDHWSGKNGS